MNQLNFMRLVKEAMQAMLNVGEVDDFRAEMYRDGVKVLASKGSRRAMSKFYPERGATDAAMTDHVVRTMTLLLQPIEDPIYG